jgi:hypothetical protein
MIQILAVIGNKAPGNTGIRGFRGKFTKGSGINIEFGGNSSLQLSPREFILGKGGKMSRNPDCFFRSGSEYAASVFPAACSVV